jgi:hypothetical protein
MDHFKGFQGPVSHVATTSIRPPMVIVVEPIIQQHWIEAFDKAMEAMDAGVDHFGRSAFGMIDIVDGVSRRENR